MPLPNTPGVYIYNGYNCTPTLLPTAASIPVSPQDSTTVASKLGTVEQNISELSSEVQAKADLADLSEVATSGSYTDLVDTPTIPIVDTQLNPNSNNAIANSVVAAVRDLIYPVGSIYLSVTDSTVAMVEARFGGTWERIAEGETLFGYKSGDTNFGTVGDEGGNSSIDISHSHTVNGHSHSLPANTGSTTLTAAQSGLPKHGHNMTQPVFTVTGGAVTNGITGGSHSHKMQIKVEAGGGSVAPRPSSSAGTTTYSTDAATHTHNLPSHTHTVTRTTNAAVTDNNGASATSGHSHSIGGNTGETSPGTDNQLSSAQSIINPYITVYMYKRTA